MTAYLVECPSCSCRIPVDSETMRVAEATVVVDLDEFTVSQGTVTDFAVTHLGRPDPAGDSDWTDPGDAA